MSNLFVKYGEAAEGISCSRWNGDLAEAVSGDDLKENGLVISRSVENMVIVRDVLDEEAFVHTVEHEWELTEAVAKCTGKDFTVRNASAQRMVRFFPC